MCDPISIASVAMTAVSSTMQIQAQNAQAKYQNALRAANIRRAEKSQATGQHLANKRLMEDEAAAVDKMIQLTAEEKQAKGLTQASATNEGLSLDNLMYDYERQKARYVGNIDKNLKNAYAQVSAEKEGVSADAASMVDAVAPASYASPVSAVISTMGSALDAYHIYTKKTPKTKDIGSLGVRP